MQILSHKHWQQMMEKKLRMTTTGSGWKNPSSTEFLKGENDKSGDKKEEDTQEVEVSIDWEGQHPETHPDARRSRTAGDFDQGSVHAALS